MASITPVPANKLGSITRILVLTVAAIGFLFDTYELLMFPVIGSDAIAELQYHKGSARLSPEEALGVREWSGRMLWIAALAGGVFGLLGGLLIDRLGRKTIMIASILAYSISPVAAAFSTELWQLVLFRCTTFIGVCVEMVAAVTWLAELFEDKRTREMVIGWTLATASLGGILVTEAYNLIVEAAKTPGTLISLPFPEGHLPENVAWRFTLLTGLIPGAAILLAHALRARVRRLEAEETGRHLAPSQLWRAFFACAAAHHHRDDDSFGLRLRRRLWGHSNDASADRCRSARYRRADGQRRNSC